MIIYLLHHTFYTVPSLMIVTVLATVAIQFFDIQSQNSTDTQSMLRLIQYTMSSNIYNVFCSKPDMQKQLMSILPPAKTGAHYPLTTLSCEHGVSKYGNCLHTSWHHLFCLSFLLCIHSGCLHSCPTKIKVTNEYTIISIPAYYVITVNINSIFFFMGTINGSNEASIYLSEYGKMHFNRTLCLKEDCNWGCLLKVMSIDFHLYTKITATPDTSSQAHPYIDGLMHFY